MRTLVVVVLSATVLGGCVATRSYVDESVNRRTGQLEADVDARFNTIQQSVDEQEAQLVEVDQTASNAFAAATSADQAAGAAQTTAEALTMRAEELEAVGRRLMFEVVIADNHDQFAFSQASLPDPARETLDEFVEVLRQLPVASQIEIEGHTDATGTAVFNARLGRQRAESVRRYLHEAHQLPLHKMNVISYGEDRPIAPNEDREGRAQNRRVVVRVLA